MEGVPPEDPLPLSRAEYVGYLNATAIYAMTRGGPFFLPEHIRFLVNYINRWLEQPGVTARQVTEAFVPKEQKWVSVIIERLLSPPSPITRRDQLLALLTGRISRRGQVLILLSPFVLQLLILVPAQGIRSVLNSAWHVLKSGVRAVPPLLTAVVVVFVTSDAWRILGTGFTPRFAILVVAFILASLLSLIRKDYWSDLSAEGDEARGLIDGIKRRGAGELPWNQFLERGIEPKTAKPTNPRFVHVSYFMLSVFSLVAAAASVAIALIVVGVILINAAETRHLANTANVLWHLPGGSVVTRPLLSLSLSLGAFAAFFLVAAQHDDERTKFMHNILIRLRRALIVYGVYHEACGHAGPWTGVSGAPESVEEHGRHHAGEHHGVNEGPPLAVPGVDMPVGS